MNKKEIYNIILYTLGSLISNLGSTIYSFAIGLYVLDITASSIQFAITLMISFLPSLLITPFAGVFADKFDKKKIVILMDILNGLLFISFYIYINIFGFNLIGIYITAFLTNIITSFFGISFSAAKPQLVNKIHLEKVNSIDQIFGGITRILAPFLGGLVYALIDIKIFIIINGFSFILSALTESFIDFNYNKKINLITEVLTIKNILKSLKEGYYYLIKQKDIMQLYSLFIGINILISFAIQVPLPFILNIMLKINPKLYGIIFGFLPVGIILGGISVSFFTKRFKYKKIFLTLSYIFGFLVTILGLPYFFPIITSTTLLILLFFSFINIVFGFLISLFDIPLVTLIQSTVDENYLGRVWGILLPMIKVVNPIGFLISGILIELVNPYLLPFISGILFILFVFSKKNKFLNMENNTSENSK